MLWGFVFWSASHIVPNGDLRSLLLFGILLLFALNEFNVIGLEFLWLNVIGALSVMGLALVIELFIKKRPPDQASA